MASGISNYRDYLLLVLVKIPYDDTYDGSADLYNTDST